MAISHWVFLAPCAFLISLSVAEDVVYVTDLTIFTLLAPCAQNALSGVIQDKTYESCGEAVTELQSCVCSKNNNRDDVLTSISESISYDCGSTASDDQESATAVFDKYCDPGTDVDFPTSTGDVVEQYPTDMEAYSELAPCAQDGVSAGIQDMTYDLCPEPATLLAPCVCGKNQNSLKASQTINSSVKEYCYNNDDITSAQNFFAAYCAMTAGTTSFPKPSMPPGDMTYYITALPQFSSLAPCAQSALDDALYEHSSSFCPEGPKAFAGCACMKSGMSSMATSLISSSVKWSCDSTATDDVSSAIGVWDFYCSAARDEVTATGVTESIGQTERTGDGSSGPRETAGGGAGGSQSDIFDGVSGAKVGTIAGGVVGGIVALGIIVAAIWFIWRKVHQKRNQAAAAATANKPAPPPTQPSSYFGKPELASNPVYGAPPAVSPVSTKSSAFHAGNAPSPPPPMPELHGMGHSSRPELSAAQERPPTQELPGQVGAARQELAAEGTSYGLGAPPPNRPELGAGPYGHVYPQELHGQPQGQRGYPAPGAFGPHAGYQQPQPSHAGYFPAGQQSNPPAELQGLGWQAGPVAGYQEMPTQLHSR